MVDPLFNYDGWLDLALREVVRKALSLAAERGPSGEYQFYISFRTHDPGVIVPDSLRKLYPQRMTIVLQHQFWALEATESGFSVTSSFNRRQERLTIPYAAIATFSDPSVDFNLRFIEKPDAAKSVKTDEETEKAPRQATPAPVRKNKRPRLADALSQQAVPQADSKPSSLPAPATIKTLPAPETSSPTKAAKRKREGAQVIALDRFRKN